MQFVIVYSQCPLGWTGASESQYCYKGISSSTVAWTSGNSVCNSAYSGATMASFHSASEMTVVMNGCGNSLDTSYWIGLNDIANEAGS